MNKIKLLLFGVLAVSICSAKNGAIGTMVKDADGNVYTTVKIGNQLWTTTNLRTTKLNDGSLIPQVTDDSAWKALTTPGYCYYNNTTDAAGIKKYGGLYNWYAVDTRKLAPKGWHVPSEAEWDILRIYLIANGYNWDGTKDSNKVAKSLAAKTDWAASKAKGAIGNDLTKNNRSGFSALPGGFRLSDGKFYLIGGIGRWWCTTEGDAMDACLRTFRCGLDSLSRNEHYEKCGYSVRLLKDN